MKEIEVVVGIVDNEEVTRMGKEVTERGGMADNYSKWVESDLAKKRPDIVHIWGANTVSCVPNLTRFVVDRLKAKVVLHLRKIRRDANDLGDDNNLLERYNEIVDHLPYQIPHQNISFVPPMDRI